MSRETNLVELHSSREKEGQELREPFEEDWIELKQWYMGLKQTDVPLGAEWLKGAIVPDPYRMTEMIIPQWINAALDRPEDFAIVGLNQQGDEWQYAIEQYVRRSRRNQKLTQRAVPAIRDAYITGTMVFKNVYRREFGQRMEKVEEPPVFNAFGEQVGGGFQGFQSVDAELFSGLYTSFVDLFRFWMSPQTTWDGKPIWCQHEIYPNLDLMREEDRRFKEATGENLYDRLDRLEVTVSARPTHETNGLFSRMRQSKVGSTRRYGSLDEVTLQRDQGSFIGARSAQLRQCWGYVPPEATGGWTYEDTQWRLQLKGPGDEILRDEPAPTPDHQVPFHIHRIVQVGNEAYGRSPLKWTLDDAEIRSELRNAHLGNVYMQLFPPSVMDREAVQSAESGYMLTYPGGVQLLDVPHGKNMNQLFHRPPNARQAPEAQFMDDTLKREMEDIAGAARSFSGQGLGSRASAFEARLAAQVGSGRAQTDVTMLSLNMEEPIYRDIIRFGKLFASNKDLEITMDDGEVVTLPLNELREGVDFLVDSGAFGDRHGQQHEELRNTVATVGALPDQALARVKWAKILTHLFKTTRSLERPSQYVVSDEEMAALQARARGDQAVDGLAEMARTRALGGSAGAGNTGPQAAQTR